MSDDPQTEPTDEGTEALEPGTGEEPEIEGDLGDARTEKNPQII